MAYRHALDGLSDLCDALDRFAVLLDAADPSARAISLWRAAKPAYLLAGHLYDIATARTPAGAALKASLYQAQQILHGMKFLTPVGNAAAQLRPVMASLRASIPAEPPPGPLRLRPPPPCPPETPSNPMPRPTTPAQTNADAATPDYITLNQAAALVGLSKRSLERRLRDMPLPAIQGVGGKRSEWLYSELRPWLEQTYEKLLPDRPHHAVR